jgi:hypothetical protein
MLATGLNPVVTSVGYSTGFVPSRYQFHTIGEAVEIITKTMLRFEDDNNRTNSISKQRIEMSNLVSKFSTRITRMV